MKPKNIEPSFKFRKHMSIGSLGAEEDDLFLQSCFIDTGDFDIALATNAPQSIILGRTGAGKTALLEKVKLECENVIELNPEELSLSYISNSDILSFISKIGVNLDLFFQLLWRHIFSVELIKKKYNIGNEDQVKNFFSSFSFSFKKDRKKEKAIEYLNQWGSQFWLETDIRVQEITQKIESEISSKVDLSSYGVPISSEGALRLNDEQKLDISERATKVVNSVQIQQLNDLIRFLGDEVFDDLQNKFYIIIDKLDENWVDDSIRHELIRALIETIKSFRNIRPVKILISLRKDLLDRVIARTSYQGFQPEKYKDLYLPLKWNRDELYDLVSKRIGQLFREQYTSKPVTYEDVFSETVGTQNSIDFMLDRTLMRPRDIIYYVNQCISISQGKSKITAQTIRDSEISYSKDRLDSLSYEWGADYPLFHIYTNILRRKPSVFTHSDISREMIDELCIELILNETNSNDPVKKWAINYYEKGEFSRSIFLNRLLSVFYKIGIIGIKKDSHSSVVWYQDNDLSISESEFKRSSFIHIHPLVWRELGIIPKSNTKKKGH
ncbi:P-loop ATPase, Sll1717 family [Marinomonas fungiae]|uniref:P-loop ATPase, Sll1717 family n=1 Tax=Marinomonas fungiae TaxID=1137284 RepID=UPI003A93CB88